MQHTLFRAPLRATATLRALLLAVLLTLLLSAAVARADEPADVVPENWNAHLQSTYIWQSKAAMDAAYSGANSLATRREKSYSFSATAAFGLRAWAGGELYLDPEVVQGVPLSRLTGLGGMTNGEQQKTGGPNPTLYRARLFLRHIWALGDAREQVASDINQLAGSVATRRLVATVGNLAVSDIFDANAYAHDARSGFLNWALLTHGAYDFAADARGYSWGGALEYYDDAWVLRAGRFAQPVEANGQALDHALARHYGDQVEVEHAHTLAGQPGKLRLLAFRSQANMGSFDDALRAAAVTAGAPSASVPGSAPAAIPDVTAVRHLAAKRGAGIAIEQTIATDIGMFARAAANDGRHETYAFAEIDRSASAGAVLQGALWQRAMDAAGVALARNGLSASHRAYLAAGGIGGFIGDGRLNYRPETIVEAYYSVGLTKAAWLTLDWQRIANPAYNADRGPARFVALRLHAQL